ncbi:MAG: hypothetical protein GF381_02660 [Candidatus Pacebacteria bacterium]|nr:hypothetical protein [Candidatus Paceibacterota bacterium]
MSKYKLLTAVTIGLFCLLFVRLGHLQLVRGEQYLQMADANRFHTQVLPAPRGVLLDRYQQPLVVNKKAYFHHLDQAAVYSKKEPVSREKAMELMAQNSDQISYQLRRYYQYPWALAHALGYLAPVTLEEVKTGQVSLDSWTGKLGLERQFEQQLRGQPGKQIYEVDTWGKKLRLIEQTEPRAGLDLPTSLDPYLSQRAYQALGDNKGAVVILDAASGQVLSLVSKPGFSANDLSFARDELGAEQARQQAISNYFQDENKVFFNRAVSGAYPPGSVFKLITALAGLDSQSLDASRTVLDEGILKVGDYQYANWYYTQYGRTEGSVDLVKAIARSNDIYFYKAAEWTGPDKLAEYGRLFGLGQTTGIELAPEAKGLMPDPAYKEQTLGERWYLGNTYHLGIGQGDILVSPVQLAGVVQAIANQGDLCQPSLIYSQEQTSCHGLGFDQSDLDLVLEGMLAACSPGGTAYPLFEFNQERDASLSPLAQIERGRVACKTGTAEFGPADERGYRQTHGWLAAIVGVNRERLEEQASQVESCKADELRCQWLKSVVEHGFPREIVILTLVESDDNQPFKEGSRDAGPVVEKIISWMRDEAS